MSNQSVTVLIQQIKQRQEELSKQIRRLQREFNKLEKQKKILLKADNFSKQVERRGKIVEAEMEVDPTIQEFEKNLPKPFDSTREYRANYSKKPAAE